MVPSGDPETANPGRATSDPMSSETTLLIAEVARLKQRVEAIEASQAHSVSEYVEGWSRAAKFLGVSVDTCMSRAKAGEFPKPCRTRPFPRANGETFFKPTWKAIDLRKYQEGRA